MSLDRIPPSADTGVLHPEDLCPIQRKILDILADGPASAREIGEHPSIGMTASPVRKRTRPLLDAGYIDRMRNPHDPVTYLYFRTDGVPPQVALGFAPPDHGHDGVSDGD